MYSRDNTSLRPEAIESFFYFCNGYHRHLKSTRLIEEDCNIFIMSSNIDPFINQTCMTLLNQDEIERSQLHFHKTQIQSSIGFMNDMADQNISSADVLLLFRNVVITEDDNDNRNGNRRAAALTEAAQAAATTHFIAVGVNKKTSRVIVYDSLLPRHISPPCWYHLTTCKEALAYFHLEHSRANAEPVDWKKFEPVVSPLFPQQTTGYDCAVYAAYSALCHAFGLRPVLSPTMLEKTQQQNTLPTQFVEKLRMAMYAVICFTKYFESDET